LSLLLGVGLTVSTNNANAQSLAYAPMNCEFSAQFPGSPTVRPIVLQDGRSFEQALFVDKEYFLRAECGSGSLNGDTSRAMATVREFAANEGLSATEFRGIKSPVGLTTIYGRGGKLISGHRFIYEFQCTFGASTFMCLAGGAEAEKSPSQAVQSFFGTIQVRRNPSAPRWTFHRTDEAGSQIFVGMGSLVKTGEVLRIELLQNYSSPKVTPYGSGLSLIQVFEFNCRQRALRSTASRLFASADGIGEVVAESKGSSWQSADSSEIYTSLLTRVCTPMK
jgi:hypothetical protein